MPHSITNTFSYGSFGDPFAPRWLVLLLLAAILTLSATIFAARDVSVALTGHVVYLSKHAPDSTASESDGDPICDPGTESADCVVSSRIDAGKALGLAPEEAALLVDRSTRITMPATAEPAVRGGDPLPLELLRRPPPVNPGERP